MQLARATPDFDDVDSPLEATWHPLVLDRAFAIANRFDLVAAMRHRRSASGTGCGTTVAGNDASASAFSLRFLPLVYPPGFVFCPSRFLASCSGVGIRSDLGPTICLLASAILCSISLMRAVSAATCASRSASFSWSCAAAVCHSHSCLRFANGHL
jgi:hypothetical protein